MPHECSRNDVITSVLLKRIDDVRASTYKLARVTPCAYTSSSLGGHTNPSLPISPIPALSTHSIDNIDKGVGPKIS